MRQAPSISIRLFGSLEVTTVPGGDPIVVRRKTRAALAYLVAGDRPHTRRELADLFCQDVNDPPAALRSLLSRIRRRLGNDLLLAGGDAVRFDARSATVDCLDFAATLDGDLATLSTRSLAATLDLYRGEFLENVQLDDSPQFELWLLAERARYRRLYERGLASLVHRLSEQGDLAAAIERARELVQSNPLREEAHTTLMRLYMRNGQKQAALEQYDYCRRVLERELAVAPTPESTALRDEIAAGRQSAPRSQPTRLRRQPRPVADDFVGRSTEMARLQGAWQAARPGRVSVVFVEAEAGVGKTRLIHEFAASHPEATLLTGACYESTSTLAYAPWLDMLEAWLAKLEETALQRLSPYALDHLSRLSPALARRLGRRRPPLPSTAPGERLRLFAAVSELLLEWPDGPPLLLFIDDLQWADEASLQLFHFLARRSPPGRRLLVGAWRAEEAAATPGLQALLDDLQKASPLHLLLAPLAPPAVRELTARLWPELPTGYRPHVADMLARATGGNPLFISEILRELVGGDEVPAALPVPRSVAGLVQRRLNRLPPSGRQVVEAMAVLDAPATPEQVEQISGRSDEETANAIDHALQRGILQGLDEEGATHYDFAHELMRSAVLDQVSDIRRALLHRRAATALEAAGAPAATLAHHWKMARNTHKEAHYARQAGEQAAAIYANEEAVRYLQRALALAEDAGARPSADTRPSAGTRLSIMSRLGDVWVLTGEWRKAETLFRQALQLAQESADRRQQARFQGALGKLLSRRGLYADALDWLEKARDNAQAAGDRSAVAAFVGTMGIVYWQQDDYDRALACYQRALEVEREMGNERGVAVWTGNIASIYNQRGDRERALTYFERSLQLRRKLGMKVEAAIDTGNIGDLYANREDYLQALDYHGRALRMRHDLGDRAGVAVTLGNLGRDYARLGADQTALICFQIALQLALELRNWEGIALHLGRLGELLMRDGDEERALVCLDHSIALFRHVGAPYYLARRLNAKARALISLGRPDAAQALSAEAAELAAGLSTDDEFSARLLALRIRTARRRLPQDDALEALLALLAEAEHPRQQAAVHYEIWRLAPDSAAGRRSAGQAVDLYRRLYENTYRRQYRRRYERLTGRSLPAPPPLPPLPDVLDEEPPDLPQLLSRVDHLYDALPSR